MHDHCCLVFDSDGAQAAAAATFVRQGLRAREPVVYVGGRELDRVERELTVRGVDTARHRARGQLRMQRAEDVFCANGSFDVHLLEGLQDQLTPGGRGAGWLATNPASAGRGSAPADWLRAYEAKTSTLCAESGLRALCQYDRRALAPEHLAAVQSCHSRTLAPRVEYADSILRISHAPLAGGLQLAGEIDISNHAPVRAALERESRNAREQGRHLYVDASALEFIDGRGAALLTAVAGRADPGCRMLLDSPRSVLRRLLDLFTDEPDKIVIIESAHD